LVVSTLIARSRRDDLAGRPGDPGVRCKHTDHRLHVVGMRHEIIVEKDYQIRVGRQIGQRVITLLRQPGRSEENVHIVGGQVVRDVIL
jgi:hypothetical protein